MPAHSTATLTVKPIPEHGGELRGIRRLELDCEHGATTLMYANAPNGVQLDDADVTKVMLAKHLTEEPDCRCIARLWREHFGAPLGEVVLARGSR
jgi:hypothetical protein